jgi:DNA polymerase V
MEIFKAGCSYQKCGVQLSYLQPATTLAQTELFDFADDSLPTENRPLMATVDQINKRFPKKLIMATTGVDKSWQPKTERISQRKRLTGES